jgi:hypothetical protein
MAAMDVFDHMLNWKLKAGSHQFPGKDGGTCINEAAIVAAGFEYRPIHQVEQMPDCFSRPICKLAMRLNDNAGVGDRQQLVPFVTRLACADTPAVEAKRAEFINSKNVTAYSFEHGLRVLEGALAIGRQAEAMPPADVRARMDEVQSRAPTRTSVADNPLFSKIKSWFELNKQIEPAD